MVLPYINMNPPQVYTCSPSWNPLPPPFPYHPSGSSQCTSPKYSVSCIEPGLAIRFIYDTIHVSMPFSQIIPPSPSPTESKRLFYTSVSLLLSRIQGYHYSWLETVDEDERGKWKSWMKLNIQKTEVTASSPITSWQIDGEKTKSLQTVTLILEFIVCQFYFNNAI